MSKYIATVTKTGNSMALRVSKAYAVEADLVLGEKVELGLPSRVEAQDRRRREAVLYKLQRLQPFGEIGDPVAWQRQLRKDRPLPGRATDDLA